MRDHHALDLSALPAFTATTAEQLTGLLGKGDTFVSQDLQSATLFGDYRVDGAVMNVGGYNEYLARLTRRISQALSEPLSKGNKVATHLAKPYLQVNTAELTGWLDDYIWTQLFDAAFNPLDRHTFARLRYVKDDGLLAFYSPDFMVRTEGAVYLVETKAQQQTIHPNVQRKLKAAMAWCERINGLPADSRDSLPWHYVLRAENVLLEWQAKGARLAELLDYARLRPLADASTQGRLI